MIDNQINNKEMTEAELAEFYDSLYADKPIADFKEHYLWVLDKVKPLKYKRLLDVACGGGYLLAEACSQGAITFGIDISETAIGLARQHAPSANIIQGSGEALPWEADYFDVATNLGSLEHFINPEKGVLEMARVLKPDGTALILLPNSYWWMGILNVFKTGHYVTQEQDLERFATIEEWRKLIEDNGLDVLKVIKYNGHSFNPVKRFIKRAIPVNLSYHFLFLCVKK